MYQDYKNVELVKPGGLELKDRLVGVQRVTKVTKGEESEEQVEEEIVDEETSEAKNGLWDNIRKKKKRMGKKYKPAKPGDKDRPSKEAWKKAQSADEEKDFKPHMMYDPKTGKGVEAKTYKQHLELKDKGYRHF